MKTPIIPDNAPRQSAITYRVGTYGDFLETMLARLSDSDPRFAPLNALRTRAPDDPTIALIDAFAAVGDVLTFYQERLANEGYLRTATEPRSVAELARLTGYRPKAGLASSVYLAFTADPNASLTVAAGARAQSIPGPGQTAQSFETSDDLLVDGGWNALSPRLSRPTQPSADLSRLFLAGVATGLKSNDPLLVVANGEPTLRRAAAVTVDAARQRTVVDLQPALSTVAKSSLSAPASTSQPTSTPPPVPTPTPTPPKASEPSPDQAVITAANDYAAKVLMPEAVRPPDATDLRRSPSGLLNATSDAALALVAGATGADRRRVYLALDAAPLSAGPSLEVHGFKTATAPAGARAPRRSVDSSGRVLAQPLEWSLLTPVFGAPDALVIEITLRRDDALVSAAELLAEIAVNAGVESIVINAVITFGAKVCKLDLDSSKTDAVSGSLSDDAGDVELRLRQFDQTGLVLAFTFAKQPVTLRVSVGAAGTPTVANEQISDAVSNLSVSSTERSRGVRVTGDLALQTGTQSVEDPDVLYLDGVFDTITPGTWVAFDAPLDPANPPPPPRRVAPGGASQVTRSAYGQTARVTRLALDGEWIDPTGTSFERAIRQAAVYAGSAPLTLAKEDIVDPVSNAVGGATLELDTFTPGLPNGRWLVATGERTDLPGATSSEVLLLAGSRHGGQARPAGTTGEAADSPFQPGETLHTTLTFAEPLAFEYKRDTFQILANIAQATQGESADEILGAGSGALANQTFTLKKPPLTFVSADTPGGSASTLRIYVDGVQWQEVDSLAEQGPRDRVFVTRGGATGTVTVQFGDGVNGSRLPTGSDNVRAKYRSGLGSSGNVDAGAIATLLTKPLGLKSVTNPRAAAGGADADGPDAIRQAAPLGLVSLSRLVAVRDYEDFAVTFAGVAKAAAKRFAGADGPLVHLTIAGAMDDALDPQSELWTSLSAALDTFGDDEHEVELAPRTSKLAVVSARVAVDADRLWSNVEPAIRASLLDRFSFARAAFGQGIHASDVIATIQATPGVAYVDLRLLTAVAAPADAANLKGAVDSGGVADIVARLARVAAGGGARQLLPAEIAYLSDSLPDMLVLNEIKT